MKRLFLGGPWDGQTREVGPDWGHTVVVPYVSKCDPDPWNIEFSQATYAEHRFYLQPPTFQHGPSQTWRIFVTGPMPDPYRVLRLLHQLDVPPEVIS